MCAASASGILDCRHEALGAVHEPQCIGLFNNANLCAIHAKRVTIMCALPCPSADVLLGYRSTDTFGQTGDTLLTYRLFNNVNL
jgi:hypothetical protein